MGNREIDDLQMGRKQRRVRSRMERKGGTEKAEMCCVRASAPHGECSHCILKTWANKHKNFKKDSSFLSLPGLYCKSLSHEKRFIQRDRAGNLHRKKQQVSTRTGLTTFPVGGAPHPFPCSNMNGLYGHGPVTSLVSPEAAGQLW